MKNCLVIHHNDPDGRMGGYIMKKYYENDGYIVALIEADYGTQFDFKSILQPDDHVCIVDFSLNKQYMQSLSSVVSVDNVTWIDHHKSAIETYTDWANIDGLRYLDVSGCELAWLYTQGYRIRNKETVINTRITSDTLEIVNPKTIKIPYGINLIGDYDCWRKQIPESEFFITGLESIWDKLTLNDEIGLSNWEQIYSGNIDFINQYISDGKIIRRYIDAQNERILNTRSFEVKLRKFNQYKIIAVNSDSPNSWIFNSVFDKYHMGIVFRYSEKDNKKAMTFSIYRLGLESEKIIDVSTIAKTFGGGGHPSASGFSTSGTLPFEN